MNSTNNLPGQNEEGILHGDFWLTQLQGKKTVHHYLAEVNQVTNMDNEAVVMYLKRLILTDKFIRNSEEVYTHTKDDFTSKLSPPESGQSERTRQQLKFQIGYFYGRYVE
jgi:phage terminase small subunit